MSPERLRAYILILMRDLCIPGGGLFLALTLTKGELWQLPLIAGMMSVPLVGRGGQPEPDPRPDRRPSPEG